MTTRAGLAAGVGGAAAAPGVRRALQRLVAGGRWGGATAWTRTNHRGEAVSLLQGPACVLAACASLAVSPLPPRTRAAALAATAASGLLGGYDDLCGSSADRGLRGHLAALASGRVTTGAVKTGGLAAAGMVAAVTTDLDHLGPRRGPTAWVDRALAAAAVAGTANLVNLLDLRPGRATKAVLLLAAPALAARGPGGDLVLCAAGPALGLLPADLRERTMLGDAGANALGALVGLALASSGGRGWRTAYVAGLVALTLASERVSFSQVIARTPVLRELDALGRRPAPSTAGPVG